VRLLNCWDHISWIDQTIRHSLELLGTLEVLRWLWWTWRSTKLSLLLWAHGYWADATEVYILTAAAACNLGLQWQLLHSFQLLPNSDPKRKQWSIYYLLLGVQGRITWQVWPYFWRKLVHTPIKMNCTHLQMYIYYFDLFELSIATWLILSLD
jgi:hypothetical protein